jgi:hypothetical protein
MIRVFARIAMVFVVEIIFGEGKSLSQKKRLGLRLLNPP